MTNIFIKMSSTQSEEREKEDFMTTHIGVCKVGYSEDFKDNFNGAVNVKVTCPSVELLTQFNNCQMTLKQNCNAKLNDKTVTVTEPQDGTQVQITYNTVGNIGKVKVTHSGSECYVSEYHPREYKFRYTHRLYSSKYSLFSKSLYNILCEKKIKDEITNQHGLK